MIDGTQYSKCPDLYEAMLRYTGDAVSFVQANLNSLAHHERFAPRHFLALPNGRGQESLGDWQWLLLGFERRLHDLQSYSQCLSLIRLHPEIRCQINTWVGNGDLSIQRTESQIIDAVLWDLPVRDPKNAELMMNEFLAIYLRFEDSLLRQSVRIDVVVPLPGFQMYVDNIRLGDNLQIARWNSSQFSHLPLLSMPSQWLQPNFAIRCQYTAEKLIGDVSTEHRNQSQLRQEVAANLVDQVVTALRVFKEGSLGALAAVTCSNDVPGTARIQGLSGGGHGFGVYRYVLENQEPHEFTQFFIRVNSSGVQRLEHLKVALSRLRFASERTREEDAIVDLAIGAEALFLTDIGDPKYRGELRYRFSVNAVLASLPGWTPAETFELFRAAYDLRSAIVHGSPKGTAKISGQELTLHEFAQRFEKRMRSFIHYAVERAANRNQSGPLFDWTKLLMSRLDALTPGKSPSDTAN